MYIGQAFYNCASSPFLWTRFVEDSGGQKRGERKKVDECYVLWKVGQGMRDSSSLVPEASHVTSAYTSLLISPWSPHPRKRFWALLTFLSSSKYCPHIQERIAGCLYICGSHLKRLIVKLLIMILETRKPTMALSAPAFLGSKFSLIVLMHLLLSQMNVIVL